MAQFKNKVLMSFFIVGSFIVYTISLNFQKLSHLFSDDEGVRLSTAQTNTQNNLALNTPIVQSVPVSPGMGRGKMMASSEKYRDGSYTGDRIDVYYGYVRVKAIISGGQLTDVQVLEYPNDRQTSLQITNESLPILRSEAITAQSAKIDIVSGATETSQGFIQSLASALKQA